MKTVKRLLPFLLSVCMLVSAFPFSVSAATQTAETVVVCADTAYTPADGEKVFATVASAIDHLGAEGGTIYVKGDISFANGNGTPLNFEGSVDGRKAVTITGHNNSNTAGSISFSDTNPGTAILKDDIIFKNITIYGMSSEYPLAAIGHKITFGEGILTPSGKYLLGARNDNGGDHKIDIYSGSYGYAVPIFYNAAWGINNKKGSSEYNVYGGSITNLLLGTRNVINNPSRVHSLNGNSVANIYGGTVTNAYVGHEGSGNIRGNAMLNIYGGTFTNVGFVNTVGKGACSFGNAVISIYSNGKDGSEITTPIAIKKGTIAIDKNDETKKFIAIINNAEEGSHSFDASLTGDFCDYMLKVNGGTAQPVFEETTAGDPSTSTFKGFRFTADGDTGYFLPTVNGIKIVPDANGIYDLSAYENKGETEIVMKEFLTPVVTLDETFVPVKGEKVFTTVSAAIDSLGRSGGTIYIKGDISFANGNGTPLNFEGTVEDREPITITGYGDSATAGSISFTSTNPGTAYIKGDIIFKNITIHGMSAEFPIAAIGHKITLGEGLVTPSGQYLLGARNDNGGDHKIDIYSGSYKYAVPVFYNASWGINNKKGSSEYNIYGGSITYLYLGTRNVINNPVRVHSLNGDSVANVYGGTISHAYISHECSGNIRGNTMLNIYGGDISHVGFVNATSKGTQSFGNVVISIYSNDFKGKAIRITQGSVEMPKNDETKKYIAIINNSENNYHLFDASLKSDFCDYMLKVENGIATPVFEEKTAGDPSTSTLIGFTLEEEYEGAEPYVNGTKLTADENGIYDLSAYENKGETVIKFVHYGQHWVKYGADGAGSSPEDPAPSVVALINNVIADTYKAGEEVTVFIMQDDGEELYNSTAYKTSDASYTASPIGEKPESHITPWKNSSDTEAKAFAANITVKSYVDGESEKNYLIYADKLGDPANITLSGNTTFDNIILVSPKKNHQGIHTNGNDLHITSTCEVMGVNAYYAENADKAWNGSFVAGQGANAVMNKDGSDLVIDHTFVATTAGRQITVGASGDVFENDANIYITAGDVKTPIYVADTTFNKNLNIVSYGTKNIIYFSANENAYVKGDVQYIYSNSASSINFIDYIRNTNANIKSVKRDGDAWIMRLDFDAVDTYGAYIDVTETAGSFRCTLDSGVLLAQNLDTLELTVSDGGILTVEPGTYDVYYLTPNEGESFVNAKTYIVALEDTEVDLSTQDHRVLDGEVFLGWKNEKTGTIPEKTAILNKGDILTAQYKKFDHTEGGDFYIYGVQMRTTSNSGLRFIIDQKKSLIEKIGGADKIIESGTLVLPTDLTHGKDMHYGEMLYDNYNHSQTTLPHHPWVELAVPRAVPAQKIFEQRDDGVLYTAVITKIKQKNYSKFYSAMGYIRYYDANGNEQILYSDYAQSSLYKVALQAMADEETEYTATQKALFDKIVNYVEVTAPALYKETYIGENFEKATKIVCAIDGEGCTDPNHAMYKLSNGLNVREVVVDWDYDASVADENTPVEIAHITDTHLNYNNAKDIGENEASIIHQYERSAFYGDAQTAAPVVRAMEYASLLDKIVITGDVVHALADGSLQVADRLMFDRNTWVGIRARTDENGNELKKVSGTLGNHERYKHMIGVVPDDNYQTYNYPALQEYFPNDIVYHSEIMTTLDGKNPVMLVLLDDQRERYEDEIIRDKLTVDLEKARDMNIPVLIFQHVGLFTGNPDEKESPSYYENAAVPNTGVPGDARSTQLTKEIYTLITDNADIVRGVFCGHQHINAYNEIIGTGENGEGHFIPQNYLDTNQHDGGFVIKISVK